MYTPLREKYITELKNMSVEFVEMTPFWGGEGFLYRVAFANGYGISIVKHDGSYGESDNLWEIAVLKGEEDETVQEYDLCYDTPVADDVVGWLKATEVMDYARQIAKLKGE